MECTPFFYILHYCPVANWARQSFVWHEVMLHFKPVSADRQRSVAGFVIKSKWSNGVEHSPASCRDGLCKCRPYCFVKPRILRNVVLSRKTNGCLPSSAVKDDLISQFGFQHISQGATG